MQKVVQVKDNSLYANIKRWLKNSELIQLKRGLYVTKVYVANLINKQVYLEFIANNLKRPSYLSGEYILQKYGMLTESVFALTSITRKKTRIYNNNFAVFIYSNIKEILEHTLITKHILPFATQKDEIRKHSKIYFIDTGMLKYIAQKFNINLGGKIEEFFVLSELLKHKPDYFDIKFWQRTNSTEVDFVLFNRINQELIPIEVKAGSTDNIPRAFDTFYQRYGSRVKRFYVANANIYKTRQYRDKEVVFIPHVLVSKFFSS